MVNVAVFSAHRFETPFLQKAGEGFELDFFEVKLNETTAQLINGHEVASIFVNDDASAPVLKLLAEQGVKMLALRSAGFNHVDLKAAEELGLQVAYVPEYSPHAVAEHTVMLMLALNRKVIRARKRMEELNFSLNGLTGFDFYGKTVGIVGLGKIGKCLARILHGFGCQLLAVDRTEDREMIEKYDVKYTTLEELCKASDVISLHAPLTDDTRYMINARTIDLMKKGVMLINTSRGMLINTKDVIEGLKKRKIAYLGLDVYEEEAGLFFEDHSDEILEDDVIARLMTFPNVLITSHQAFLTNEALQNIADTTFDSINAYQNKEKTPTFLV